MCAAPPVRYHEWAPRLPDGPIDFPGLVPGDGPIELDVGFGRGLSLFERARTAPDVRLIGIEVRPKWVVKVDERLRSERTTRVRVFAADVREALTRAGPEGCLARAFVLFPDPWWKRRHQKRRVLDAPLIDQLARLLRSGGEFFVQTDVEERAIGYRDMLRARADFTLAGGPDGFLAESPFVTLSNRERRSVTDGLPVWRLLARRRALVENRSTRG